MTKVNFFEIRSNAKLRKIEVRINEAIAKADISKAAVRLFETGEGEIGYSLSLVPTTGGKRVLERVHRIICDGIGYRRGRPPGKAHQVKCRVSETVYERLRKEADRLRKTPSGLVADLVARHVHVRVASA